MTQTAVRPAVGITAAPAASWVATAVAGLAPNHFAAVMGTGIVATAAVTLPAHVPGLRTAATLVWVVASLLLVALSAGWVAHRARHRRRHADDPVMAQFWGAPPMALLTVGAGTLLLGRDWIGASAALRVDVGLWLAGTAFGLVTAAAIPYLMITRHEIGPDAAFGGWLMPVVPPMVSAATGALLVPYAPAGQTRLSLVVACYAMFGVSLFATLVLLPQIWSKLVVHGPGPARAVPTMWIVLGPLGQSVTAANALGTASASALPAPYAHAASVLAVFYGIPTLGFGLLWMAIAGAVTVRTVRSGMPFALTWWGFTFPVGTMATGAAALAAHTGSAALRCLAVALYALLVVAWSAVAVRTARAAWRRSLWEP